jgi:hypothetical protein
MLLAFERVLDTMNLKRILGLQTLAVSAAMMSVGVLPMAAQAQSVGTDAAIGAALGSIAGSLLFDSNRNQYYYVNSGHRHFVSHQTASWYHQYGGYHGWQQHHHEGGHRDWHGNNDGGNRDGGHGGHDDQRGDYRR